LFWRARRPGPPVNVISAIYFAAGTALYPRPNLVSGQPLEIFSSQYPDGKIFNKAAFVAPPSGTQGNFGQNVLRGFRATQADVALQRQFHLTEKVNLRLRSEFFNIFNHPNFNAPNFGGNGVVAIGGSGNITDPHFGEVGSTRDNPYDPRQIQFALKLYY
jgi:hypothetical protein